MTTPDPPATEPVGQPTGSILHPFDLTERERFAFALSQRFAPHLEAAAAAVREAEQILSGAREQLSRAREADARQEYRSDRLVFMRASVNEEVNGLARKTTPKKVRVAYRYLLDRAVELAAAEVQEYISDQDSAQHARQHSVEACIQAEREASERLEAAHAMHGRVKDAEHAAREGLAMMVEKLGTQHDPPAAPDA
jgi:hypothetical protein